MAALTLRNEAALVALLKYERMKPSDIHAELLRGNTPEVVYDHRSGGLVELDDSSLWTARRDIEEWRGRGIEVLTPFTQTYPSQLRASTTSRSSSSQGDVFATTGMPHPSLGRATQPPGRPPSPAGLPPS